MATTMQIAAFYVALNALISVVLSFNVARNRMRAGAMIGDAGDHKLVLAQRAHGNNVEYVPFALVMLVVLALMQTSGIALHILGAALTVARALHGYGINRSSSGTNVPRAAGALVTWVVLLAMIVLLLLKAFQ